MKEVGIKRGNFGGTWKFVVKNVNWSAYGAKLYVQSPGSTVLINGTDCVVSATDSNRNTLVQYSPASGHFGISASLSDYYAEITFSGAGFRESTETFLWQIHDELRG